PWRASDVPMKRWEALFGSTAMPAIERPCVTARLPGTRLHEAPASDDVKRPSPASESLEPFGSPVPTSTWAELWGSTQSEPIALVVRPDMTDVQAGVLASASLVRQTPPPAAPT